MPSPQTATRPFNPDDYTIPGTFAALTAGLEETVRRWDEIPIETALLLPAFYMEGRDRGEEHGVQVFRPASPLTIERERAAVSSAGMAVLKRARADGIDPSPIVRELRASLRPIFEAAIAQVIESQRPKGLFERLFGR